MDYVQMHKKTQISCLNKSANFSNHRFLYKWTMPEWLSLKMSTSQWTPTPYTIKVN